LQYFIEAKVNFQLSHVNVAVVINVSKFVLSLIGPALLTSEHCANILLT